MSALELIRPNSLEKTAFIGLLSNGARKITGLAAKSFKPMANIAGLNKTTGKVMFGLGALGSASTLVGNLKDAHNIKPIQEIAQGTSGGYFS